MISKYPSFGGARGGLPLRPILAGNILHRRVGIGVAVAAAIAARIAASAVRTAGRRFALLAGDGELRALRLHVRGPVVVLRAVGHELNGENLRHRCRSVRRSTPPPAVAAVSCWASCPRPSVCSCEAPAIAGASVWKCRRWRPALFLSVLSYRFSVWFRRLSFRLFASLFRRSNIDSPRIYIEFPSNLY